ncbi:MAG: hypothetical protein PHV74_15250 [Dehalococcoidia bacterium]|nr:hypothetical protein [Dehalococcoidia bacterium]
MKTYQVSIQGVTPLLMHRFPMDKADSKSKKRTGVPDWKEEALNSLYTDEQGRIYEPSDHIEGSLKEAARQFKITGKRSATYAKLIGSTVAVSPAAIPHKITDYVVDSRPVVVQRARVIRYRPRFDKWEIDFEIRSMDDQLDKEVLKQILDYAGSYVGIGDFRPGRGGKFGKFIVTRFVEG